MSDISMPHRIHLLEEAVRQISAEVLLLKQGVPRPDSPPTSELEGKLKALEAKYKMLNARMARKDVG